MARTTPEDERTARTWARDMVRGEGPGSDPNAEFRTAWTAARKTIPPEADGGSPPKVNPIRVIRVG
jgi:hypothetical protein